ncbi:hypothetical protein ABNF97_27910 [Plantactinospora sp. B6F1]|uniref:hypothetical protein n=1 Tax=Plantactinospora sp. B6F1 TaxID=3158971 RepID=UPI0032D8BC94
MIPVSRIRAIVIRAGRTKPRHRRDWRRLWRYCRCGWRWRCPDSVELVPMPYPPPQGSGRAAVVPPDPPPPAGALAAGRPPDPPPPPPRVRTPDAPRTRGRAANSRFPLRNSPTRSPEAGRAAGPQTRPGDAGALTPAQTHRAAPGSRAGGAVR